MNFFMYALDSFTTFFMTHPVFYEKEFNTPIDYYIFKSTMLKISNAVQ